MERGREGEREETGRDYVTAKVELGYISPYAKQSNTMLYSSVLRTMYDVHCTSYIVRTLYDSLL